MIIEDIFELRDGNVKSQNLKPVSMGDFGCLHSEGFQRVLNWIVGSIWSTTSLHLCVSVKFLYKENKEIISIILMLFYTLVFGSGFERKCYHYRSQIHFLLLIFFFHVKLRTNQI